MMNIETWRYHANRWQTWFALAVLAAWIVLYAIATANSHTPNRASSGYWPAFSTSYAIPYGGAMYRPASPSKAVDIPSEQLVLLGEHDGAKFYGRPGDRIGGGGGYGGPVYPRLYMQDGDGKFIPLERTPVDPNAGKFMR